MCAEASSFPLKPCLNGPSRPGGMGLLGDEAARFIHLWEDQMRTGQSLAGGSAAGYMPPSMNLQVFLELGLLFEVLPGGQGLVRFWRKVELLHKVGGPSHGPDYPLPVFLGQFLFN